MATYSSWWLKNDPLVLSPPVQQGDSSVCWSISLTRQMEAGLRLEGRLRNEQSLSIQETINIVTELHRFDREAENLCPEGAIWDISFALDALRKIGTVLETDGPELTFSIGKKKYYEEGVPRYKLFDYTVLDLDAYFHYYQDQGEHFFEQAIMDLLTKSPISANMVICPSAFTEMKENSQAIYKPTLEQIQLEGEGKSSYTHWVLLTGFGSDKDGRNAYWECQDSQGDPNNDGGKFLVGRGYMAILSAVEMDF